MGTKLDALLGRRRRRRSFFNTSKLKTLVNLSISRVAVLKKQRQVRCSQAQSDVCQLLKLGHHERALLRVELVIKEQNMLDVFALIQEYCHLLIDKLLLIQNNKECPDELKEAILSLIFASWRCGEFPELQKIRQVFTSRFGNEFAVCAVGLQNNCGVNYMMIQKMSTRPPSLESRLKVLKEIVSENNITLHLKEESSVIIEEHLDLNQRQSLPKPNPYANLNKTKVGDDAHVLMEEINRDDQFCGSLLKARKYRDLSSTALDAFESVAYAAAARAVMELSRSESQYNDPDYSSSPISRYKNKYDKDGSSRFRFGSHASNSASGEFERSISELGFKNIRAINNSSSESEGERLPLNYDIVHSKELKELKKKADFERSLSASSSDSVSYTMKETKMSSNLLDQTEQSEGIAIEKSDYENGNEHGRIPWLKHSGLGVKGKSSLSTYEFSKTRKTNKILDSTVKVQLQRLNLERRPISVRTRRGNGQ